jgi:hypothetical protein
VAARAGLQRGLRVLLMRRPHLTRTDVVLTVISACLEAAGLVYFVHRRGWFRA